MLNGTEGSPLPSTAQMATYNVTIAGSDPPVDACPTSPTPGAPAPVALNSFTGNFPVITK